MSSASATRVHAASNVPAPTNPGIRYRAFLSYSHSDTTWARWLMRRLESYRVPRRFRGRSAPIGTVGLRIAPVFRDRDELPTTPHLGEAVRAALRDSATLVVICSPAAARSRWVHEEILAFKRVHGEAQVFAFVVAGEPKAEGAADDCFSAALRHALGPDGELSNAPTDLVAADARPEGDGRSDAFVRLVAGLLGVGFDELRLREYQRRQRRFLVAAAGLLGVVALGAATWLARVDAQRRQQQGEQLLGFVLGDQRAELKRLGRLDILEQYDAKALAFFGSMNTRDLTDNALARQAHALRNIGENRLDQMRYDAAMEAFQAAYSRAAALAARHPDQGDLVFERGQAEFWIGMVHRRRGETDAMGEWWARYRETGRSLVKLDPNRMKWLGELAYGLHNMAAYDRGRGRIEEARRGFRAELELLGRIVAASPADVALRFRIVDANSWLGSLEELDGNFSEAGRRFADQVTELEAIIQADPGNAKWRVNLADALALRASIHALTGERALALDCRRRVASVLRALVDSDPTNRTWQKSLCNSRVKEARIEFAEGRADAAKTILAETIPALEAIVKAEPTDITGAAILAAAYRLEAETCVASAEAAATAALGRAIELGERIATKGSSRPEATAELARALVLAATLARRQNDEPAALRSLSRARALLTAAVKDSAHWQVHDAHARVLALSGDGAAAEATIARLAGLGYRPLEPWPAVKR